MSHFAGFPKDTLRFLSELREQNKREWFAEQKGRYEASVVRPALEMLEQLQRPLRKAAPLLRVEAKKTGGSLMRIYKDTRFSKDKTPYKTHIGIQLRHEHGRDIHAPGVYIHIDPSESFLGIGTWRPPREALLAIRQDIVERDKAWAKLLENKRFKAKFSLYEDRLKSTPRGFDKQHPLIDLLRQQSFIGMAPLSKAQVESAELVELIPQLVKAGNPLMVRLCEALEQPW